MLLQETEVETNSLKNLKLKKSRGNILRKHTWFPAAAGGFLTAESAADLRPRGGNVDVHNTAVGSLGSQPLKNRGTGYYHVYIIPYLLFFFFYNSAVENMSFSERDMFFFRKETCLFLKDTCLSRTVLVCVLNRDMLVSERRQELLWRLDTTKTFRCVYRYICIQNLYLNIWLYGIMLLRFLAAKFRNSMANRIQNIVIYDQEGWVAK